MRVLVTGATGAVGPSVLRRLVEAGHQVRVLARRPDAVHVPAAIDVVAGDLTDRNGLVGAVAGCGAVVHLAALLHVASPPPELEPEYDRVNVEGTARLLEAGRAAGVERFVLASTTAVYGPTPGRVADENDPPRPDTWYSQSKLRAEQRVLATRLPDGRPLGTVLRLSAVYGSRIKGNYRRLVLELARHRFVRIGAGENRRSLVHEDDVGAACALVVAHPRAAGRVYNIANPEPHTVSEIVEAICKALGRRPPRLGVPIVAARAAALAGDQLASLLGRSMPLTTTTLSKYLEDSAVATGRAREELGYATATTLQEGWAKTVAGMRAGGDLPGA